uniref:Uncharacterized protein n=1 Tax=Picea glauca TaxID=3330 RepID=A0A124GNX1_PICGL|nr:hypothetical protein ABT39_MTgene3380 [Picea glauca]
MEPITRGRGSMRKRESYGEIHPTNQLRKASSRLPDREIGIYPSLLHLLVNPASV